jgi:hypothetical protein
MWRKFATCVFRLDGCRTLLRAQQSRAFANHVLFLSAVLRVAFEKWIPIEKRCGDASRF